MLPTRQPGGVETAPPELIETAARFATAEHEAIDTNAGYQSRATVPIGKLRLRFALEGEARVGLRRARPGPRHRGARRPQRGAGRRLTSRRCWSAAPPACWPASSTQLQGLLHHRAEALAGRVSETATRGAAEIADYLLLQVCNRYEPLLTHLAATRRPAASRDLLPRRASASPASSRPSPRPASGRRRSRRTGTTTCRRRSAR